MKFKYTYLLPAQVLVSRSFVKYILYSKVRDQDKLVDIKAFFGIVITILWVALFIQGVISLFDLPIEKFKLK